MSPTTYTGRFAPSPTGPLHFGSLVAALASCLDARAARGTWLLRIEDLDAPRVRSAAAGGILSSLETLGLEWDGVVRYQHAHIDTYLQALRDLEMRGLAYPCGCTRREIADSALAIDGARIYPGTCRGGLAPGKRGRSVRLRTASDAISFADRVQGAVTQSVEREIGDYVLRRADGVFSYQLAVAVDDAAQGVTDVERGADLLDSTARQILLLRLLGQTPPRYLHVPIAVDLAGEKLSKQTRALPIDSLEPAQAFRMALEFLGHFPPAGLTVRALHAWGVANWDVRRIPRRRTLAAPRGSFG